MTHGMRILTWHVHGSYLHYLTQSPHSFYLPVDDMRSRGHGGRSGPFAWGANVFEVPRNEVSRGQYDVVLYQSSPNWSEDRYVTLSEAQRRLPSIYLEHDPPQGSPTNTQHPIDDPNVLVVHVTAFNALMWDSGRSPVAIIDHGVIDHGHLYSGELERGLVVVNGLARRGRRLGADIFERARAVLPLDLVGMFAEESGGIGEVPLPDLPAFSARYRLFFHPIRYTSLGLGLLEAMMLGMPVVGLATTELPTIIRNGQNGFVATDEAQLHDAMRAMLADRGLARAVGEAGRRTALERFNIDRFAQDWTHAFDQVAGRVRRVA